MNPPNASLFLVMICFWVTFWLVQRYLIGPVGRVVAERQGRIESAERTWASKNEEYLSATSRLEAEMEDAAREAARVRGELRQQALDRRQDLLTGARATADGQLRSVMGELAEDAEKARVELRQRAEQLAALLASQLLEREVKP
jgi:F0F1-type ATP synthase membrane subunit b/b'